MNRTFLLTTALSLVCLAAPLTSASAEAVASAASESRSITVAKDKSMAFRLDAAVGELVVAAPDIAEIVAKTDHSFYIRGKKAGSTNVLVYGPNQQLVEVIDVRVGSDAASLRQDLAAALPNETIQVMNYADGVMLSGQVSTSAVAARARQVALRYAAEGAVATNLTVRDSQQIVLEVRVVEASRSAMRDLGIDLSVIGTNGSVVTGVGLLGVTPPAGTVKGNGILNGVTIDATLRALEDRGVLRTLAKPNLVALSGEEASFLAGGEFPFPVPQGRDQVTIEFKPYGVKLKFTPNVQENGMIRLKVEPEVSALDRQQSVRINGIDVPSLSMRRASTTVEMEGGKSLAIAGLFQQDEVRAIRQTPGLGNVPILGALFRSERFNSQETELVIIVTPHVADANAPLPDPFHNSAEPMRPSLRNIPTASVEPVRPAPTAAVEPARPAPAAATPPAPAAPAPVALAQPAPVAPAPVPAASPAPAATPPSLLVSANYWAPRVEGRLMAVPAPSPVSQAAVRTVVAAPQPVEAAQAAARQENLDDLMQRLSQASAPRQPDA